jgi:transposase
MYARCAGLDVHKDTVVACARIAADRAVEQHVETFGTTTSELLRLAEWLDRFGVTHVAMEATGVYWKPVWHVLEESFELVLANAMHIRNVPGRKTDVNDAMWIADLLAHGLIRASFVPPTVIQDLRAILRTRKQLVREKSQHVLRVQKVLEDANVKLSSVVTDIMGKSGRAMLDAIVAGETDPDTLVALASKRLRATREALTEALRGQVRAPHRLLLKLHLGHIDTLDASIAVLDKQADQSIEPFRRNAQVLTSIPGVSDLVAQVIVSEIGYDMTRFASAGHLRSWAGLCPRNDESAGKRRSTRTRPGAPWLKTTLVQAAWCATRAKDTYLRSQFLRLKARRGPKKAIIAVAATILTAAYYMLRDGVEYRDLGPNHFDQIDKARAAERLVRKLQALGYGVELKAA